MCIRDSFSAATGNIYSRFTNPTVRMFQERLAALEGGESCIATGSGMAAILATCMALLKSGDHIVSASAVFGTTGWPSYMTGSIRVMPMFSICLLYTSRCV